jgi:hypothetical protein
MIQKLFNSLKRLGASGVMRETRKPQVSIHERAREPQVSSHERD